MNTMFKKDPAMMGTTQMNGTAEEGFFGQDAAFAENTAAFVERDILQSPAAEIDALADAIVNEEETFVDAQGAIHIDGESNTDNMSKVDGSVFGGPEDEDEELRRVADALYNDDETFVDKYGRIHLDGDVADEDNMTMVDGKTFGAYPSGADDEIQRMADALYNDTGEGYYVDEYGRIHLDGDSFDTDNMTKMDGNIFGAHEDQWYNKNPNLMRAEIALMRKRYPKAVYGYYKSNGNMYWIVTLQIFQHTGITKPWQFQIVYDKDHPHNRGYGGSLKVVPLKPSLDELRKIAMQHGRPGVPHVISLESHFLKRYLCTRWPEDIANGKDVVASAAQAAAWAADWAAHFEIGIRDKRVWNKWCDDDHFRHMQVK